MIIEIEDNKQKEKIARTILESVKDWFMAKEGREHYINSVHLYPMIAEIENGKALGFVSLEQTSKYAVNVYVCAVLKELHRSGIGTRIFEKAFEWAKHKGFEFMFVQTVKEGLYEDYDRTNKFYQKLGFRELQVFPGIWDEKNPCQIYVKSLK